MAKEHNCKRFLNDMRKANILLSVADLFDLPKLLSVEEFNRSWKRAVFVGENRFEEFKFYETTAINKGLQVKVFTEKSMAIEWLRT